MYRFNDLLEGDKRTYSWKGDNDGRRRACNVKLMKRDLEGGIDGVTQHWALYFDWTDRAATYEGLDEDGALIPKWNLGCPNDSFTWQVSKTFNLECSPQQVNVTARQIEFNGRAYLLTDRNCHHWVIELASKMGLNIDDALETYLPGEVRNVINLGHCLNNMTGCFSRTGGLLEGSSASSNSPYGRSTLGAAARVGSASAVAKSASAVVEVDAEDDSTRQTRDLVAVGGAILFAGYAFHSLFKSIKKIRDRLPVDSDDEDS